MSNNRQDLAPQKPQHPQQPQSNSSPSKQSSSFSFSSTVSSAYTSTYNQQPYAGHRSMQSTTSNNQGTTVNSATQNLGEPAVARTRRYDAQGREIWESRDGGGGAHTQSRQGRVEDVTDEGQAEERREYEERIEEEYAKREGGA